MKRNEVLRRRFRRIIAADQPPCAICGCEIDYNAHYLAPNSFQIDHIVPLSKTGPEGDVLENLQPSCRACNRSKSDQVAIGIKFVTERNW